jgi:hypothetical protein
MSALPLGIRFASLWAPFWGRPSSHSVAVEPLENCIASTSIYFDRYVLPVVRSSDRAGGWDIYSVHVGVSGYQRDPILMK